MFASAAPILMTDDMSTIPPEEQSDLVGNLFFNKVHSYKTFNLEITVNVTGKSFKSATLQQYLRLSKNFVRKSNLKFGMKKMPRKCFRIQFNLPLFKYLLVSKKQLHETVQFLNCQWHP